MREWESYEAHKHTVFRVTIVYCENYTKQINTLCVWQNAESLELKR
jgi:hypothetical protein